MQSDVVSNSGIRCCIQFGASGAELLYTNTFGPKRDIFAFVQNSQNLNQKFVFLFELQNPDRAAQILGSFTKCSDLDSIVLGPFLPPPMISTLPPTRAVWHALTTPVLFRRGWVAV